MLFNSLEFLIFFPLVVCAYFALPERRRWVLLLAASYYFYGSWKIEYLGLLLLSTAVDYVTGRLLERDATPRRRKWILGLSLGTNLGMLCTFKYLNFFFDSANAVLAQFGLFNYVPELRLLLPVGISFYTFQSLSYTIDVYRRRLPAERHLGIFAVYVAFFPQLVAGPIERPSNLLPQFRERHRFDWPRAKDGLQLMLWGFVKKVCIADRLAPYVATVYDAPAGHSGATLLLATYCFAVQIYCDFSGYTDIARGAARVMGYELMLNFRQPYLSRSIREFWSRWHISLSSWFRDYVYVPLGGNRVSRSRWHLNLFITFLISGLWHGANWTFVIWGALHGMYVVCGNLTEQARETLLARSGLSRWPSAVAAWRILVTFHLVLLSWVFFRANHVGDALLIAGRVLTVPADIVATVIDNAPLTIGAPFDQQRDVAFMALVIALMALYTVNRIRIERLLSGPMARAAVVSAQFWAIVIYGKFDNQQFIYFQF